MKHFLLFLLLFVTVSLSAQKDATRYTVYYFLGEDCRICQYYTPEINKLDSLFAGPDVDFVGLFPSRYSTEKGINEFKEKYAVTIPLKLEYFATKTKKFGVTITPEVVIYDNEAEAVIYKGRIDDSYVRVGRRKRVITNHDLEDLLSKLKEGEQPVYSETTAVGCYITFRD